MAFSGDKLLGGPQAGIVVGRAAWVSRIQAHPLTRALRVDKLTVAALEATLRMVQDGRADAVPARALAVAAEPVLRARADALRQHLADVGLTARVVRVEGQGGGTLPLARPPSWACLVDGDAEGISTRLRTGDPAVLGRIEEGRLVLDVRCIEDPGDRDWLAAAVAAAHEPLPGV